MRKKPKIQYKYKNLLPAGAELVNGKPVSDQSGIDYYRTDTPVTISIRLPEAVLKEGHVYRILCVSENGETFVYETTVENGWLTFLADRFYAYALIGKD